MLNLLKIKNAINLITIGSIMLLAGCACNPVYVTNPLDRPERPVLPHITEQEAGQINNDVWKKIVDRYDGVKSYAEKLEIIIDSTHSEQ